MENKSQNKPDVDLVSILANRSLDNPNEPQSGKVVLYDECGDALWDDVLAQESHDVSSENNGKDKSSLPDKIIKGQTGDNTEAR